MTNTERGAAKRLLDHLARQIAQEGRTPAEAIESADTYCQKLPLVDRMTPALLLAWLAAGQRNGRHIPDMLHDALILLQILNPKEGETT